MQVAASLHGRSQVAKPIIPWLGGKRRRAYGGLRSAQTKDEGLRADVDTGHQRLHVAAACPATAGGVPKAGAGARVGDGARAELDPAARPTYFSLRAGTQLNCATDCLSGAA